ncbi:MAG: phage holin family protein [Vicinamibacterales bacterium]
MAEHQNESIAGLLKSLVVDTRDLMREELALMRAEVREELAQLQTAAIAFGAAVVVGAIGVVLFFIALGGAVAYAFHWPSWAGYGIMAVLLLAGAAACVMWGKREIATLKALPKTRQTVKENIEWIQSKSAQR